MASPSGATGSSDRVLIGLFLFAGLIGTAFPLSAAAADAVEGHLSAADVLTSPGHPVKLQAHLAKVGLGSPGLGGEPIEFLVGKRVVGRTMTGGDGRAYLEYTPRIHGVEPITARLAETRRVRAAPAEAMLFAWERRRPVLLVELAAVLEPEKPSVLPALPGNIGGARTRTPVPGAAEELARLAKFFVNIIYIARDAGVAFEEAAETRAWLVSQHFPAGFVVRVGPRVDAFEAKLDELRGEGWDRYKAGIGRSLDFADLLVRRRIAVIVVPPPERGDLPKKAQAAKDWKEVRRKLQG